MNNKQLVTVWVGIALILIHVSWRMYVINVWYPRPPQLWAVLIASRDLPLIVAALAVGLTCTFADKKPKDKQKE